MLPAMARSGYRGVFSFRALRISAGRFHPARDAARLAPYMQMACQPVPHLKAAAKALIYLYF